MGGGEGAPLALGRLELGRLQNLDRRRLGARAARHVLVELVDGVCQLEGAELLVRVVRAGARLVAEPEPEVLHSQRLLLVNLQRGRRGGKSSEGRVAEAVQLHRPDATNREWSAARPPLSRRTPSSRLRSSPQSPVRSALLPAASRPPSSASLPALPPPCPSVSARPQRRERRSSRRLPEAAAAAAAQGAAPSLSLCPRPAPSSEPAPPESCLRPPPLALASYCERRAWRAPGSPR